MASRRTKLFHLPASAIAVIFLMTILLHTAESLTVDHCVSKSKCHDCIQTMNCSWCLDTEIHNTTRCFHEVPSQETECTQVWRPTNNLKSSNDLNSVYVSPRNVKLDLRVGKFKTLFTFYCTINNCEYCFTDNPYKIKLKYIEASDNPIDLYYLMDWSNSMKDDKDTLSNLGESLHKSMKDITSKFKLGFGAFVDKVLLPYTSIEPQLWV